MTSATNSRGPQRRLIIALSAMIASFCLTTSAPATLKPAQETVLSVYNADPSRCDPLASTLTRIMHRKIDGTDFIDGNEKILRSAGYSLPKPIPKEGGYSYVSGSDGSYRGLFDLNLMGDGQRRLYIKDRCNYCIDEGGPVVLTDWYVLKQNQTYSADENGFPKAETVAMSLSRFLKSGMNSAVSLDKRYLTNNHLKSSSGGDEYQDVIDAAIISLAFVRPVVDNQGAVYLLAGTVSTYKTNAGSFGLFKFSPDKTLTGLCAFVTPGSLR